MADGYRCIMVMCLFLFPPYRKYCSHVNSNSKSLKLEKFKVGKDRNSKRSTLQKFEVRKIIINVAKKFGRIFNEKDRS